MGFLIETVGIILVSAFSLIYYIKSKRSYWAKKNVPTIKTKSIFGNMENPITTKRGLDFHIKDVYDELKKREHKHGGIYLLTEAAYIPVDPELIKHVLAKDFSHFVGHGISYDEKKEPTTAHLFNLDGEKWRNMRVKLTPTFTSGKMKMMFNTLLDCGVPMLEHIDKLNKNKGSLDIKEIVSCYTTDIIGSCAFGLECNSFKDPDAEFRKHGRAVFHPTFSTLMTRLASFAVPSLSKVFYFRFSSKDVETFFINIIKNVLNYRETNSIKRNDFVQLFLEMNQKAKENGREPLTLNEIAAQSFVFFIAGFETSSTTMTFCLHELAFNQSIQDKLRKEVKETMKKYDGKLTYDGMMEMQYMDQVINETLRKYPPAASLTRVCNMDYKVPNTDVTIEAGTKLFISILGVHRDEEYYPNPDKFDPERFTEENEGKRPAYTFIPFGEGPRMCIGLRFGVMQAKTGLAMLLNKYKVFPGDGETYDFDMDPKSIVLTKKGRLTLNLEKLTS